MNQTYNYYVKISNNIEHNFKEIINKTEKKGLSQSSSLEPYNTFFFNYIYLKQS